MIEIRYRVPKDLKIIDWERDGKIIRFYLGDKDLKDWWGDDWNDQPYEHNAGAVYREFVKEIIDVGFTWETNIIEISDLRQNTPFTKDDFKTRGIPILLIDISFDYIPDEQIYQDLYYRKVLLDEGLYPIYMGDDITFLQGMEDYIYFAEKRGQERE